MPSFRLLAGLLVALGAAAPAAAQGTPAPISITVPSGRPHKVAVFGRVLTECRNGLIRMRLAEKPRNGTVTTKLAKGQAGLVARCPKLVPEAVALIYKSRTAYRGADRFAIEIVGADGKVERHAYAVTVK